jgi:hypothetical protein
LRQDPDRGANSLSKARTRVETAREPLGSTQELIA